MGQTQQVEQPRRMDAGFGMYPPARFSFGMRGMLDSNDRLAVCGAARDPHAWTSGARPSERLV